MPHGVFVSYARTASAEHARALAEKLGDVAFLDTEAVDEGDPFPPRLLNGLLDARVVVVFATRVYSERRFCRLEMRLALAAGNGTASHVVLALGEGARFVLDAMPQSIASQSWPPAEATSRLEKLVRGRLEVHPAPLRSVFAEAEAQGLAAAFLEESNVPEPQVPRGRVSLPPGAASRSIGSRFVGRGDQLRHIHQILSEGFGANAALCCRLTATGGFGKTRLATEYLYRYGPRYYPGGLFWVNAASRRLDDEFWRILKVLDEKVPPLKSMREEGRDVRQELEGALRGIGMPVLYVIDDIPEAGPGESALPLAHFCPALGAVTVLATSRQDTREEGVRTIEAGPLGPDASVLLLTENLPGARRLSWDDWGRAARWVGHLPLALDLLNRCLALNAISIEGLLDRMTSTPATPSAAEELDSLREGLRGQIPEDSVRGIGDVFGISLERLQEPAQEAALLLAQLAPAPIPEAFVAAMPEDWRSPAVRAALHSRHLVTGGDTLTFGVMHPLVADFLRSHAGDLAPQALEAACSIVDSFMTADRCRDPHQWAVLNLFRPHAQFLLDRAALTGAAMTRAVDVGEMWAALAFVQGEYPEQQRIWERVVEISTRVLGREHPKVLHAMKGYARSLRDLGNYRRAREIQEQVLETRRLQGEDDPDTLGAMSELAATLRAQQCYAEAQHLYERLVDMRTRLQGEDGPDTLGAMSELAATLRAQQCYAEAQRLYERLVDIRTRLQGEDHPDTLGAMSDLAMTLGKQGRFAEGRALQEHVLEKRRRHSEEAPSTLKAMTALATLLEGTGELAQAEQVVRRAVELTSRVLTETHPLTLEPMVRLASILSKKGDLEQAKQVARRTVEVASRVLSEHHPGALGSMEFLASLLSGPDDHREGERLLERVVEARTRLLGEDHPDTLQSMQGLAEKLLARGERETSGRLLDRVLAGRMHTLGAEHPDTLTSLYLAGAFLVTTGKTQEGLQLLRQCLGGQAKVLGPQHGDTKRTAELFLKVGHAPASGASSGD